MPVRAHPGRCHRCARRSPESAPGVGGPDASGGVTGAGESQWHVGIAPPLPSDWPERESRGWGLRWRATVKLCVGRRCCAFSVLCLSLHSCRVRRHRHGPVSNGTRELSESGLEGSSRPRRRFGSGGRLSPASWRPEPRISGVPAPLRLGLQNSPHGERAPQPRLSLCLPRLRGRIRVARKGGGGGQAWLREPRARSVGGAAGRWVALPAGPSSLCGRRGHLGQSLPDRLRAYGL